MNEQHNQDGPAAGQSAEASGDPNLKQAALGLAARTAQEPAAREPDPINYLTAKGQTVLYRAKSKGELGEDGEEFHAAVVTRLHEDWSVSLTVFPNGRTAFHVQRAVLTSNDDPTKLEPGEFIGNR